MKKLLLVDGHSIAYRAYFALGAGGAELTAPDGRPTGAILGFLNMLVKYINMIEPTHISVAFDRSEPTSRHEIFPEYKATRRPTPEDLRIQIDMLRDLLPAMGIDCRELPGYEADDIIGTFVEDSTDVIDHVYILSGDKDDYQLISSRVSQIYPGRGNTERMMDPEAVFEELGVRPEQMVDYMAITGDPSDNISGVKGIGAKGAAALINEFGSLEKIYENVATITGARQKYLTEGREDAFLSQRLATIQRDVPLEIDWEDIELPDFNQTRAYVELTGLGFSSLPRRLNLTPPDPANGDGDVSSAATELEPATERKNITWSKLTEIFAERLSESNLPTFLPVELQERSLRLYLPSGERRYEAYTVAGDDLPALLRLCQSNLLKLTAWQFKEFWRRTGVSPTGAYFDLETAAYFCYEINGAELLPTILALGKKIRSEGEADDTDLGQLLYLAERQMNLDPELNLYPRLLQALAEHLAGVLGERDRQGIVAEGDMPLVALLARMERIGCRIDREALINLSAEYSAIAAANEQRVFELAGSEFNLNSSQQLAKVLYEDLGLPPGRRLPSGAYSTDADELRRLGKIHRIIEPLTEYRKYSKLVSTFLDGFIKLIDPETEHIHTTYHHNLTTTGRLSSTAPNLQNIPVRHDEGREIRRAFIAEPGNVLLDADYSQIELRLLAHFSQDDELLRAFRNNEDVHRLTASGLFGVAPDFVTKEMRAVGKTVNFSIVYGISDFGLSGNLDVPITEAREYLRNYNRRYPLVKPYMDSVVRAAHKDGYVETLFGRRRTIPELAAKNRNVRMFGERAAMNAPIQGTAADIIRLAMVRAQAAFDAAGLKAQIILQVHDELLVEVKAEQAVQAAELLTKAMTGAVSLSVPLVAEVYQGLNWLEAVEVVE